MRRGVWLLGVSAVLLAVLGIAGMRVDHASPPSDRVVFEKNEPATTPPRGSRQDYPEPGDPHYADYLEMLRQPEYQLSVSNSPGFRLPYDPEWRSMRTGRREVAVHDRAFTMGGSTSLDELAEDYIFGLNQVDEPVLRELQLGRQDFVDILWPEFPQSRPATRIPAEEAWYFAAANIDKGLNKTVARCRGRRLELEGVQILSVKEFTNFRILEVRITALDQTTGESIDLTGDQGGTVVERFGRYKFYLFQN